MSGSSIGQEDGFADGIAFRRVDAQHDSGHGSRQKAADGKINSLFVAASGKTRSTGSPPGEIVNALGA